MKRIIFFIGGIVIAAACLAGHRAFVFYKSGASLYLPLDTDLVSVGRDNIFGTLYGGLSQSNGYFGGGCYFDGNNANRVEYSNQVFLAEQFTIAAWAAPKVKNNWGFIADNVNLNAATRGWKFGFTDSHYFRFQLQIIEGTVNLLSTSVFTNDFEWHHFAATYDGTTANLFVDGELQASSSAWGYIAGLPVLRIGYLHYAEYSYSGILDEFRFFDRALSAEEIKALYEGVKL